MKISALVRYDNRTHEFRVKNNESKTTIYIKPKNNGRGSAVNGGELLFLALASCYCNDIYREAAEIEIDVQSLEVYVEGEFGATHSYSQHSQTFCRWEFKITFAKWDACQEAGGCSFRPDDFNWGRGNRVVLEDSWNDAREYTDWLSCITGTRYRLPSVAEWEYFARASSRTNYPWGDKIGFGNALCLNCGGSFPQASSVGRFKANEFGLFYTLGSVSKWVEDCLNSSYEGAPTDGSAWTEGNCYFRVTRGGEWYSQAKFLTSSYRNYKTVDAREDTRGFRVVREISE